MAPVGKVSAGGAPTPSGQAGAGDKTAGSDVASTGSIIEPTSENELEKIDSGQRIAAERAYIEGLQGIKALGLDRDLELDSARALGDRFARKYGVAALRDLEQRLRRTTN